MPRRITPTQREHVLRLLAEGQDRDTIAATVGVTPGQVSAVAAHVTMGSYALPEAAIDTDEPAGPDNERTRELLERLHETAPATNAAPRIAPILLGDDVETGEPVYWNPDPASGTTNPHVLILGESGTGKTYAICCLLAELARQGIVSIVFDYGQGLKRRLTPLPIFLKA
jgi:DNA phosphorothioation-dependent restriction protein DptH